MGGFAKNKPVRGVYILIKTIKCIFFNKNAFFCQIIFFGRFSRNETQFKFKVYNFENFS